jgi:PAS domain-containing protein
MTSTQGLDALAALCATAALPSTDSRGGGGDKPPSPPEQIVKTNTTTTSSQSNNATSDTMAASSASSSAALTDANRHNHQQQQESQDFATLYAQHIQTAQKAAVVAAHAAAERQHMERRVAEQAAAECAAQLQQQHEYEQQQQQQQQQYAASRQATLQSMPNSVLQHYLSSCGIMPGSLLHGDAHVYPASLGLSGHHSTAAFRASEAQHAQAQAIAAQILAAQKQHQQQQYQQFYRSEQTSSPSRQPIQTQMSPETLSMPPPQSQQQQVSPLAKAMPSVSFAVPSKGRVRSDSIAVPSKGRSRSNTIVDNSHYSSPPKSPQHATSRPQKQHPDDVISEWEDKKQVKRAANRLSASLSRKRKKMFLDDLTHENTELRRKEQILRAIPDLIVAFDASGTISFVSESVSRFLNYNTNELEDTSFWDCLTEDSVKMIKSAFMDALAVKRSPSEDSLVLANGDSLLVKLVDKHSQDGKLVSLKGVVHFTEDSPECVCSIRPEEVMKTSSSGSSCCSRGKSSSKKATFMSRVEASESKRVASSSGNRPSHQVSDVDSERS